MMPKIDRAWVERHEKVAQKLDVVCAKRDSVSEPIEVSEIFELLEASQTFERPKSLARPKPAKVRNYEFTDAQLQIALRLLDAEDPV